jgi:hypothetical protein
MIKTILKIKEAYSGNFKLQEILLMNLLLKNTSDIDDLPVFFVSSKKKGGVYDG